LAPLLVSWTDGSATNSGACAAVRPSAGLIAVTCSSARRTKSSPPGGADSETTAAGLPVVGSNPAIETRWSPGNRPETAAARDSSSAARSEVTRLSENSRTSSSRAMSATSFESGTPVSA
jgi:hypothetical protein